jgi:hypothetical protein
MMEVNPIPSLAPLSGPSSSQQRLDKRVARRHAKILGKKKLQKERDRLILIAQKERRRERNDEKSIAAQRLKAMGPDYQHWVQQGEAASSLTPPRLVVPATGASVAARQDDPETMLFHLLSRRAETIHPGFFGSDHVRETCDVHTMSPIWYGWRQSPSTNTSPSVRHPACGRPRDWMAGHGVFLENEEDDIHEFLQENSDADESEAEDDSDKKQKNSNKDMNKEKKRRRPISANPQINHPTCWHRVRSPFAAHPAFGHRFPTSLVREHCVATRSTPVVHGRSLRRKPLPKPFDEKSRVRLEQLRKKV